MPPVTPSAMRAISTPNFQLPTSSSFRLGIGSWTWKLLFLDLDDLAAQNFLLRNGDLLLALFAWHGAGQQLARAFACEDDEFEPVFLGCSLHDVLSGGPEGPPLRPRYYGRGGLATVEAGFQARLPLNVAMMFSAVFPITCTRARSASTMARSRSTAVSNSSFTTTY